MKIGMVLDKNFPPDTRVENEAKALVRAGHEVVLLCLRYKRTEPAQRDYNGIALYQVYRKNKANKRARGLINTALDYNTPYWARRIKQFAKDEKIDVLHVHDLFLFGAALRANRRLGLPLVGDTHENYVSGLTQYRFSTTFPGNILISTKRWRKKEREWISKLDYAVTVIDEMKDRISEYIDKERIVVYLNVPDERIFQYEIDQEIINRFKDRFILLYMGAIDYHRGIETVIRALSIIKNEVPDVHLLIVGQGSTAESLKELANGLGVLERITFEGHVSENKVPSYCKASDIGLIPHLKSEQTDNSCPNKIFQYMATRLPVLTNDCRSLARLVRETGSGVVYKADDPVDMAKQVVRLYASPAEREKMGLNGSEAVKKTYHYERQVAELVNFYHELSKKIKE